MAVKKETKQQRIEDYVNMLNGRQAVVFVQMSRIGVNDVTRLRTKIRETGSSYMVIKNSLLTIALKQAGWSALPHLVGPIGAVFCGEDIATTVKAINEFGVVLPPDTPFAIVGGIVGSDVLNAEQAKSLAELPSKSTLFAQILSGIQAPASQLSGVIANSVRQIVNVLQARVDQLQEGQSEAQAAA